MTPPALKTARIVAAGPAMSAPLLDPIAGALAGLGHHVTAHYGEARDLGADWAEADVAVWYGLPCGHDVLARAPSLRAVVAPTIGCEWIDHRAATDLGILVVNGQVPENYESMAEAAVLLMLAALYDLRGTEAELRGTGRRGKPRMLRGKTVGIIGFGNIARCLVTRLEGWGVRILANTRTPREAPGVAFVPLDALIAESDVVVVLASLNGESLHLLEERRLARIRRDAVLLNLSRGPVVDEAALARLVAAGHLSAVALDVFEVEPLPADSPLRALPNAILTPHSIGHTTESFAAIPRVAVANVLAVIAGEVPASTLNPDALERWKAK
ncbi:MAG: NAD(P)-dependent oxidoreductase [Sphingomonadales bacterium]